MAVSPARSDDLNITTKTTSAVATATAANASPGNITISSTGSVETNAIGAAVTIDSNNSVINSGTISNSVGTGAVGVRMTAGKNGSFTNNGTITITGTGSPLTSTGQSGILLDGTGVTTANISMNAGSKLTISGSGPIAVSLRTELMGNVNLGGTIEASGTSAAGFRTAATITGAVVQSGSITTKSGTSSTSSLNSTPNSPFAIGGSVTGGILNAGPSSASSGSAQGVLTSFGSLPAMIIAPSVGANTAALNIGPVSDATDVGYGIINRGKILGIADQPTTPSVAMQIGESSDSAANQSTTIAGGLFNRGTISATATSANTNATGVPASPSNATGLIVGGKATVPSIVNQGTISAETSGPAGGNSIGITMNASANVTTINNIGSITASANTSDNTLSSLSAVAIQDFSGKLTTINNGHVISATATTLANGAQAAIAADLRASSVATTFNNAGRVTGDILFGIAAGHKLSIEGANAIVSGRVTTVSVGTVDITVSGAGTGGTLDTSSVSRARTLTVGANGKLNLRLGQNTAALVATTGEATFATGSRITVVPAALVATGNYTLVQSSTALTFGDYAGTTSQIGVPFLFSGQLTKTDKALSLSITRKTAGQLGLTGDVAAIYEPAMAAGLLDNTLGAALVSLPTAAALTAVLEDMSPKLSNIPKATAAALTDFATGPVGTRQRTLHFANESGGNFGIWAQGFRRTFNDSRAGNLDWDGNGGTFGLEWAQAGASHFGVAISYFSSEDNGNDAAKAKLDNDLTLVSFYSSLGGDGLFVDSQIGIGFGNVHGTRTVNVGPLTRVASASDWTTILGSGAITAGFALDTGGFKLTPQVGISGFTLAHTAHSETGGGAGINLAIENYSEQSASGFVGLGAGGAFEISGTLFSPQMLVGWRREFYANTPHVGVRFDTGSANSFDVTAPAGEKSAAVVGAGLDMSYGSWLMTFGYDATFGSKIRSQSVGLTLGTRF